MPTLAPSLIDIDEDATEALLDTDVRRGLDGLSVVHRQRVAEHLVMTTRLLDEDPELALLHARAARVLAARVGYVREAVGLAAYRSGEFAEALAELRSARRLLAAPDHIPVMADCERGLGRPEKALALAKDPEVHKLDRAAQIELMIVVSGARRDLGQAAAAVVLLQGSALDSLVVQPWTINLWYAYAAALHDAGRLEEALQWFGAAASIDEQEETDAHEQAMAIEELLGVVAPVEAEEDLEALAASVVGGSGMFLEATTSVDSEAEPDDGGTVQDARSGGAAAAGPEAGETLLESSTTGDVAGEPGGGADGVASGGPVTADDREEPQPRPQEIVTEPAHPFSAAEPEPVVERWSRPATEARRAAVADPFAVDDLLLGE